MATLGIQQGATWTLQVLSALSGESAYWSPETRSGSNPGRTLILNSSFLLSWKSFEGWGKDIQELYGGEARCGSLRVGMCQGSVKGCHRGGERPCVDSTEDGAGERWAGWSVQAWCWRLSAATPEPLLRQCFLDWI